MDEPILTALQRILSQQGEGILSQDERLRGLLMDFLPNRRREIRLLMAAVEEGIVAELRALSVGELPSLEAERLARRLWENYGFEEGYARWAVQTWAAALRELASAVPSVGSSSEAISAENIGQVKVVNRLYKVTVNGIAFSPDGKWLAVASRKGVYLYDAETLEQVRYLETRGWIASMALSPDEPVLASGLWNNMIIVWDPDSGVHLRTLEGHGNSITSIAFSPDGRWLASGSYETVMLWDVRSGERLRRMEGHRGWVLSVAFSPDGNWLASGSYATVMLWDALSGERLRSLEEHDGQVLSVAFSPHGRLLASASWDHTVLVWDVHNGGSLHTLEGHNNWVWSVAFSPDGRLLASGSWDNKVMVWDVDSGKCLRTLKGHSEGVKNIAFSPEGRWLASGSWDGTIVLWGIKNEQDK